MKFVQLILRKIINIVATRCQILKLKCTKFDFGWGALPQTPLGELTALPRPLAGFEGSTSKGGEGRGKKRGGDERGEVPGLNLEVALNLQLKKHTKHRFAVLLTRFLPCAWFIP